MGDFRMRIENAKHGLARKLSPNNSGAVHIVFGIAACLIVALLIQATLFNIPFWTSIGLQTSEESFKETNREQVDSQTFKATYEVNIAEALEVRTISIESRDSSSVALEVSDEGHLATYTILEDSIDAATQEQRILDPSFGGDVTEFTIYPYGKVDRLSVVLSGVSPDLSNIVLNPHLPFKMPFGQLLALCVLCLVIYLFRVIGQNVCPLNL